MAFAPLSEVVGRRPIYASTLLIAVLFILPGALSKNIATLLVGRAIDGIAFSAPMTLVGGTLADLWKNEERGVPMAAFSAAPYVIMLPTLRVMEANLGLDSSVLLLVL